jgi:hypothetical protein
MDIYRTTFTGFEEQFDYPKECMWKKWSERTEQLCSKRRYDGCEIPVEMIPHVGWRVIHLGEKRKKIPSQEMMIVCVNSLARARLPLEKVVAMAQLCEYRHWWYLALWWSWWYIAFLQTANSMLMGLTSEVLTPSVKAALSLQGICWKKCKSLWTLELE